MLTAPVMHIHYSLFKHATWLTERKEPDVLDEEHPEVNAACFCKAAENPGRKALKTLADLLSDPTAAEWGPAVLAFGPVMQWSQTRLKITRRSFCVVIGQLWRKLLHPWTQYPWKLALLIDPEESADSKRNCANQLFSDPLCCLDGFSRKLREQVGQPEALLHDDVLEFLQAVLERVVPTSTYIERMFARLTEWSTAGKGPKPSLCSVAAKHCNHQFERSVNVWRAQTLKQRQDPIHKKRPAWIKAASAKSAQNGWHAYLKDYLQQNPEARALPARDKIADAKHAWSLCSAAEKAHWASIARGHNVQAMADQADAAGDLQNQPEQTGGPWNCGCSSGFPLARHVVADKCNKATARAACFKRTHNVLQPENSDSLEGGASEPYPLFPSCPVDGCQHSVPEASRPIMDRLITIFWQVVLKEAPTAKMPAKEPLLFSFSSPSKGVVCDVAVMFHTRRSPLQAALLRLHMERIPELAAEGVVLSLRVSPQHAAGYPRSGLQIVSESGLFAQLSQEASDWDIKLLTSGPVRVLSRFDIVSDRALDEAQYGKPEQQAVDKDLQGILNAFQLAHPSAQGQKRRHPSSVGRQQDSGATRSKKKKLQEDREKKLTLERKLQGLLSASSESDRDSGQKPVGVAESDAEADADSEAEGLRPGQEPSSGSKDPPAPAAARWASGRVAGSGSAASSASKTPGPRQPRSTAWGVFEIAPVYSKFFQHGWSATCNMHHNDSETSTVGWIFLFHESRCSLEETFGVIATVC